MLLPPAANDLCNSFAGFFFFFYISISEFRAASKILKWKLALAPICIGGLRCTWTSSIYRPEVPRTVRDHLQLHHATRLHVGRISRNCLGPSTTRTSQVYFVDRARLLVNLALGLSCSSGFVPWRGPLGLRAERRRRIRNGERERERDFQGANRCTGKPSAHSSVAVKHFQPNTIALSGSTCIIHNSCLTRCLKLEAT